MWEVLCTPSLLTKLAKAQNKNSCCGQGGSGISHPKAQAVRKEWGFLYQIPSKSYNTILQPASCRVQDGVQRFHCVLPPKP